MIANGGMYFFRVGDAQSGLTQSSVGEGEVLVVLMTWKKFQNAVPACVFLINKYRNGVPVRSVTEVPQLVIAFLI
jgi:hypothetical protein